MVKPRTVFNQTYNECLDLLVEQRRLPSDARLSTVLDVSRTTVRSVLAGLADAGLIDRADPEKRLRRSPGPDDYFSDEQTDTTGDLVERQFMERILREDASPGQRINELEIARETGVSTGTVREFLIRFSRFGLIEKKRNSNWMLKGFTREFALDLADVREMFETRSALLFITLPAAHPGWRELGRLEADHFRLEADRDALAQGFSLLDERFHRLIHTASQNRFIIDFYDVIAMVFHYHYQWNKADEAVRNAAAVDEHLAYIAALRSRDTKRVEEACARHLRSARETLLRSVRSWSPHPSQNSAPDPQVR